MLKAVDIDNKKIVYDGHMITASLIVIDLFNPNINLINIEDIAHGLANTCRWNGHTQKFWSVAQHCCMMFDLAPKNEKLKYLLHDSEEAYWGDMIKPLKNIIQEKCPEIIDLMHLMKKLIYDKFQVEYEDQKLHDYDFGCLQWEFEAIIKGSNTEFWLPTRAKSEFLKRFNSVYNEINKT